MVINLREGKARLSELVAKASSGEDVLIAVRGKVKARLTRAGAGTVDNKAWVRELRKLREANSTGRPPKMTIDQIIDELREDRF
jgi:prevent-host-death family protein